MGLLKNDHVRALLAGSSCVFGFAPFGVFPVPVLALAVLFGLWQHAGTPRRAAWSGFVFGLGLFGAGISWIYVALHDYGDMPMLLAAPATMLFAAFLALFIALAGYAQARFPVTNGLRTMLVMPAAWVSIEWLRGMIFTGFPWLTLGYAHSDSPLAGYAPLLGVYGVSLAAALSAGSLAWLWQIFYPGPGSGFSTPSIPAPARERRAWPVIIAVLLLWGTGALLRAVSWTQPHGEPFSVALVQGNIAQDIKFNEDALVGTLETYRRLVLQHDARLTLLPESALPLLRHEMPANLLGQLRDHAAHNGGDVLIGSFERDHGSYYNSVFSLGAADEQHYRKQHLVPFGEFIPLRPLLGWFINGVLDIPMGDLARGDRMQAPLDVAGQHVAVNICYEDVFGEEIIRALPQATLLVNVTNDAWYGHSYAAAQHNQMSQMRALESGRMMLRATNTGVTSIIGTDGKVLQQLPQHVEGVLLGTAQGHEGSTPYARWGNAAALLLIALLLAGARLRQKRIAAYNCPS
ncbi:MAG TPA: apolipoprotein N-acyltransferase [Gallionella sp.]|nr:apolipoprotein N-acyltransferase [Gallionella sp.]